MDSSKPPYHAVTGTYNYLYRTLLLLYHDSVRRTHQGQIERGINAHASNGLSAFVLATVVWESWMNFHLLGIWARPHFGQSIYEKLQNSRDRLKKMSILDRTYETPFLAFGKTFDKQGSPYEDLSVLVRTRNRIVHDWSERIPINEIEFLRSRNLLLERHPNQHALTWNQELSTLECVRWCINTLSKVNTEIFAFSGEKMRQTGMLSVEVTEQQAKEFLHGGESPFMF
jgi:hypothetical protein